MNVGCHVNATPHVIGQVFVTDNADATTLVDACDGKIIKPCVICPEQPRAYHTYKLFKVYENTNRPFEPQVVPIFSNLITCSYFSGFTPSANLIDIQPAFYEICNYARINGIPPFAVKLISNPPSFPTIPIFNVYGECSNIPSGGLEDSHDYTFYFNGLNCGKTITVSYTITTGDVIVCLNNFDYSTITSADTYASLATEFCTLIQANCAPLQGDPAIIDLIDPNGNTVQLVDLNPGCDTTTDTTPFVFGQTYQININGGLFKIIKISS